MFKTSLKSKLNIAVIVMFGITAFMSCDKNEIEEANKASDISINDSVICKLAQKHNEYLMDIVQNYDYKNSQDHIASFKKNFINSDLDDLNKDDRIKIINNMRIGSSLKSSQIGIVPSTVNDLVLEIKSSKFPNKNLMIEVIDNATSIISNDKSTCSEVNTI